MRFFPSKYPGKCACGAAIAEGDPVVYDSEARRVTRCGTCPDLSAPEVREVANARARAEAAKREADENARRAAEAPTTIAEWQRRAGGNAAAAIAVIYGHAGIRRDLDRHGIAIEAMVSALANLAAADSSRAGCSAATWIAAAEQCAAWGLVPSLAADTPVYLFCRDRNSGKLSAERTRYGLATQLARALDDCTVRAGWVFAPEAILGDLAARIRDPQTATTARAEADALRARLEARAGNADPDRIAMREGLALFFDGDQPFPVESKPALARAGKAAEGILRDALRAIYASKPLSPEQREAVMDYRMDLDTEGASLRADESALLAALRLPNWEGYAWYAASGEATDRAIVWAPPSEALWSRPPMDWRREEGCPRVWWVSVEWTDDRGRRHVSGMELARTRFYERAVAGKTVRLSSAGLLIPASDRESHILTWHGEAGTVKALREWLKAHPTLLESARVRAALGSLSDEQDTIEGEATPTVGVEHLRHIRRQLTDGGAPVDYAAESQRVAEVEAARVVA